MEKEKINIKTVTSPSCKTFTPRELAKTLDHSILKPQATTQEIKQGAEDAKKYGFRSLVVHPCKASIIKNLLLQSNVLAVSVADFPHGRGLTSVRTDEINELLKLGIDEIDIVSRYERLREGDYQGFKEDTREVIRIARGRPLKIILEVDNLSTEQIKDATRIIGEIVTSERAKNIIIKTKTGFAENKIKNTDAVKVIRETLEEMNLYAKTIHEIKEGKIGIKTSGGIKTQEDAIELLTLGAHILGTSSSVSIVTGETKNTPSSY